MKKPLREILNEAWNKDNVRELELWADNTHHFDPERRAQHHAKMNRGQPGLMGDKDAHRQVSIYAMKKGNWARDGYKIWRNFVDLAAHHYTREHGVPNGSKPEKIEAESRNIFSHADRTRLAMMYQDEFEKQYDNGELDHLK